MVECGGEHIQGSAFLARDLVQGNAEVEGWDDVCFSGFLNCEVSQTQRRQLRRPSTKPTTKRRQGDKTGMETRGTPGMGIMMARTARRKTTTTTTTKAQQTRTTETGQQARPTTTATARMEMTTK
jgi:hypothetical protein